MPKLNTHDTFTLARLINATNIQEYFKNELEALMNGDRVVLDPKQDGLTIVFALMTAMAEDGAEQAFYEFVSGPLEMSPKQIEELPPEETLGMLMQVASVEEWKSFFRRAAAFCRTKTQRQ